MASLQVLLPFSIRTAMMRCLLALSPAGDGLRIWAGKCLGTALQAREGYLAHAPAEQMVWQVYNPGSCHICSQAVAHVKWLGHGSQRPREVPGGRQTLTPRACGTLGPREGPRGARFLVCRQCYLEYGARLCIVTYPSMTEKEMGECQCLWDGTALATCPRHHGVKTHSGIFINRGYEDLRGPQASLPRARRGLNHLVLLGDTQDGQGWMKSELESLIDHCFPVPSVPRAERRGYSQGPGGVRLGPSKSRDAVLADDALTALALDVSVSGILKLMLGARPILAKTFAAVPFTKGYQEDPQCPDLDWFTDCSIHKARNLKREVLTWVVSVAEAPAGTSEQSYTEGATHKPRKTEAYVWVEIRVTLDVTSRGAIRSMQVWFQETGPPQPERPRRWWEWRRKATDQPPKKRVSWLSPSPVRA